MAPPISNFGQNMEVKPSLGIAFCYFSFLFLFGFALLFFFNLVESFAMYITANLTLIAKP